MRRLSGVIALFVIAVCFLAAPQLALAQTSTPTSTPLPPQIAAPTAQPQGLSVITPYPMQEMGVGETTTLELTLRSGLGGVVQLSMKDQPKDWTVTFNGNGKVIQGAYVEPGKDSTVELTIVPPNSVAPGVYNFTVQATENSLSANLPVVLTVKNKLPPKLTMTTDLPTLNGTPSTTFSYNVNLSNGGEESLNVILQANAPSSFQVSFQLSGQNVTNFPLDAHAAKTISVSMQPVSNLTAGNYTAKITADGGVTNASINLTAVVSGAASLSITTPDGRLSDQVTLGQSTPIKVVLQNNGTASARQINLTSSAPAGWKVTFDPATVSEVIAGGQVEITANLTPTDQAIAGDYQVTITANQSDNTSKSADFRITVVTSTLWGLVGVILIAVAVGVVAAAVLRFGRR